MKTTVVGQNPCKCSRDKHESNFAKVHETPSTGKKDGSVVQEYQQDIGTFVGPYPRYPFGKVYK